MNSESHQYRRHSIRLKGYDYATEGAYLVTICTKNRECRLGEILGLREAGPRMVLNELGKIVQDMWVQTEKKRAGVALDEFIVMPNHVHGIIVILERIGAAYGRTKGGCNTKGVCHTPLRSPSRTVGAIVRGFKSSVTGRIRTLRNSPGLDVWQRNYHERIIRNDRELNAVREYIRANPANWEKHEEYAP